MKGYETSKDYKRLKELLDKWIEALKDFTLAIN